MLLAAKLKRFDVCAIELKQFISLDMYRRLHTSDLRQTYGSHAFLHQGF